MARAARSAAILRENKRGAVQRHRGSDQLLLVGRHGLDASDQELFGSCSSNTILFRPQRRGGKNCKMLRAECERARAPEQLADRHRAWHFRELSGLTSTSPVCVA